MDDPELADKLKIGLVFQNGALFDSLTVGENVGFQLLEHSHLPLPRIQVKPLGLSALTSYIHFGTACGFRLTASKLVLATLDFLRC